MELQSHNHALGDQDIATRLSVISQQSQDVLVKSLMLCTSVLESID